jgi:hypothetical protein
VLSKKIAVAVGPKKQSLRPRKHIAFYLRYALTVQKTLRSPLFQKFIRWMLRKENIAEQAVKNVQVMVFPFRKKNGNGLAGRWNGKGGVLIYPRRLEYCQRLMQKQTEETVHAYIRNRARAALMHELLHIKYLDDEKRVRKLTKQYFHTFIRHLNASNSDISNMMKMLFKH